MSDAPEAPPGWSRNFSKSQNRYYYSHADTQTTQWHFPTDAEIRDPTVAKRLFEKNLAKHNSESKSSYHKRDYEETLTLGAIPIVTKKPKTTPTKTIPQYKAPTHLPLVDSHSVAIIVPFRDIHPEQNRSKHLKAFVPHMLSFLRRLLKRGSLSHYHVYIVEQSDDGRKFNRGKLLNIGFDYAKKNTPLSHDIFIFHDVDLLPGDDLGGWYSRFPTRPIHIARCWDRYSNNPKYFGGIVSFNKSDMHRINGFPNTFWGWGGEDDEMQKRCEKLRLKWEGVPEGTITDLEDMTLSEKLTFLKSHKEWKCMVKWEALKEHDQTWKTNGLADLSYTILNKDNLDPEGENATKITCDIKLNPNNHWGNEKCGVDYMPQW